MESTPAVTPAKCDPPVVAEDEGASTPERFDLLHELAEWKRFERLGIQHSELCENVHIEDDQTQLPSIPTPAEPSPGSACAVHGLADPKTRL